MTETPCVFVNVQRGGPSTGLPTLPGQADMMQARWGSHGDYGIIALCPNSPQECFDLTIQAFNLSEEFRVPVMMMMDECVGHMTEKVVIPEADQIEITPRRYTKLPPEEYRPFEPREDLVPDMARAGEGYRFHVTGLTHDERGYPSMSVETQDRLVRRLLAKLKPLGRWPRPMRNRKPGGCRSGGGLLRHHLARGAARHPAGARARHSRRQVPPHFTAWPFPAERIRELAGRVKAFVVPELNLGQMVLEVERAAAGQAKVIPVSHAGGTVHNPDTILNAIVEAAR